MGSHQASRRLLQSGPSPPRLLPSLEPPSAPSPQQPDAAPARQRRVKKDVEIAVAVTIGLILLVGGVFCVLAVVCRRDKLPAFIRKLLPHKTSARPSEYSKYQDTQEQCLPNNLSGVGRGAAPT
ncbi:MAG: hypothetical protein WDW38_002551 [Sanguina aurantia]